MSKPGPINPETGKRTEIGRAVRGSRVDAAIALARLLGDELPPDVTWDDYWSGVVEPTFSGLSERTASDYRRLWDVELRQRIGASKVADLNWHAANAALTDIKAPTVQRYAGRLLKKMCNMAIRDGLLAVNPVDRRIEYAPHRKRPKRLVDASEVAGFLETLRGCPYEPLLLCELGAGLRPEEARALLWEDVRPYQMRGWTYCAIEVSKALTAVSGRAVLRDTKNSSSARTAVMGDPFAARLLELAEGKSGPLVPSGLPYDPVRPEAWHATPSSIGHGWAKWCAANGVERFTEENMRSSYASMMGEALAPDSVVAGNMGHSDGTTKGVHYQRVTMRAKCAAAGLLADFLAEFHGDAERCGTNSGSQVGVSAGRSGGTRTHIPEGGGF